MTQLSQTASRRILVIDDSEAIHADFRKLLEVQEPPASLTAAKAALFGPAADASAARPLQPGFEVDAALQGEEGFQKVQEALKAGHPYRVAFVDMRMPPGWDGLETIKRIWQVDYDIQIVICTAYSDYSLDQITRELGYSDRLLLLKKPFDSAEVLQLASALSEKWELKREAATTMEQLKAMVREQTAEIEHALLHDRLTGLPNRTLLTERLTAAIQRQARHPESKFGLLFLDLDRFKIINDSLGHEAGDLLLIEIAQRLRDSLRGGDMVSHTSTPARLGGDDFLVLLEGLREEPDAARVAERLLAILSQPYTLNGVSVHVTASIGVALSDWKYEQAGDMIRDADTAMYRAKAAGGARYVMFDREMHEQAIARLAMEGCLRDAVEKCRLTLHYQPIIRLRDQRLAGFEALVRWNHPERGSVPATDFIRIAEDTGLILQLGLWVLGEACRQIKVWRNRYPALDDFQISVNMSRKQLIDPDLISKVQSVLDQSGVSARAVVLEITESIMLDEPEGAIRNLADLRKMGFDLHLDDFGTGYSSLSCLHQLPISGLKIDRAFIHDVCRRQDHAAVLRAILQMSKAFKLRVTAEGVETTAQASLLRQMECHYVQGFLFGRPTDAEAAEAFLREHLPVGSAR